MSTIQCAPENAQKFWDWIENRGGVAVWSSVNLSNPGGRWFSPALSSEGKPYDKPTWEAENFPSRYIRDPAEVVVTIPKEVKRFYVAIRRSSNGLSLKVTDGGSRKIHKTLSKIQESNDRAWYEFDYSTQEAVFYVPDQEIPLVEYIRNERAQTRNAPGGVQNHA